MALSRVRNLRQTKERQFRARTSETKEKIMESSTSGRSLIEVEAAVIIAILGDALDGAVAVTR